MSLLKTIQRPEVSEQRPMPVDVIADSSFNTTVSGETVQLYYYKTGTLTQDAGQAAGTVVVAKLAQGGVLNDLGDVLGTYYDTSFAFVTGTILTTQVAFPYDTAAEYDGNTGTLKAQAITNGFANGEYCIDHATGTIYGVKATAGTSDTANYKYASQSSGSSGGLASDITKIASKTIAADDAAFTPGTSGMLTIGGFADETSPDSVNEGDTGAVRMTLDRKLHIASTQSHDDAVSAYASMGGLEAKDFDGSALPNDVAEGDMARTAGTLYGIPFAMLVNEDGSKELGLAEDAAHSSGDLGIQALAVRNDTLAALADTDGDYTPLQVSALGALYTENTPAASTADIGSDPYFDSDGDNTAQALKASGGALYSLHVINENATDAYVQLFDTAAGSVTVGTTTPVYVLFVPANGAVEEKFTAPPLTFGTAITYACTTTATGNGDPSTGLVVSAAYK